MQPFGMHVPPTWHVSPDAQPEHWQGSTHAPATQVWFASHVIDRHGSTQTPTRHTCPCGQTTPSQGATHWPPTHFVPSGHVTSTHVGSTQ
jgi:hypothetical protein